MASHPRSVVGAVARRRARISIDSGDRRITGDSDPATRGRVPAASAGRGISPPQGDANRCEVLLSGALEEIRRAGFDKAEAILNPLRTVCPASAGPWRELGGVRFAQRRWQDAAALAGDALARDPHDAYA